MNLAALAATLATLVAAAGISVPMVNGLMAVIKTTFENLPARYYPTMSIVCGIVCTAGLTLLSGGTADEIKMAMGAGVLSGLLASGVFRGGKQTEYANVLKDDLLEEKGLPPLAKD